MLEFWEAGGPLRSVAESGEDSGGPRGGAKSSPVFCGS